MERKTDRFFSTCVRRLLCVGGAGGGGASFGVGASLKVLMGRCDLRGEWLFPPLCTPAFLLLRASLEVLIW